MTINMPAFVTLSETEARAVLARHNVGRLAYTFHDHVDIEPVHYTVEGNWIYGRTSIGTKLAKLAHHPWCAFEVDDVRGLFDWESAVARGAFHLLDPETGSPDTYQRALTLLRELVPGTLSALDPVPHRNILFGIHIDEITGRAARPPGERRTTAPRAGDDEVR
jgi:nitroimidazol reductase NimA-like FMN-containing flavoprotein (pyridoxamine 5'-phosphate oxidase superfamily)